MGNVEQVLFQVPTEDHSYWWRHLLGPDASEELIADAHELAKRLKSKQRSNKCAN